SDFRKRKARPTLPQSISRRKLIETFQSGSSSPAASLSSQDRYLLRRHHWRIVSKVPDDSANLLLHRLGWTEFVSGSAGRRTSRAPLRDKSETPRRDDS